MEEVAAIVERRQALEDELRETRDELARARARVKQLRIPYNMRRTRGQETTTTDAGGSTSDSANPVTANPLPSREEELAQLDETVEYLRKEVTRLEEDIEGTFKQAALARLRELDAARERAHHAAMATLNSSSTTPLSPHADSQSASSNSSAAGGSIAQAPSRSVPLPAGIPRFPSDSQGIDVEAFIGDFERFVECMQVPRASWLVALSQATHGTPGASAVDCARQSTLDPDAQYDKALELMRTQCGAPRAHIAKKREFVNLKRGPGQDFISFNAAFMKALAAHLRTTPEHHRWKDIPPQDNADGELLDHYVESLDHNVVQTMLCGQRCANPLLTLGAAMQLAVQTHVQAIPTRERFHKRREHDSDRRQERRDTPKSNGQQRLDDPCTVHPQSRHRNRDCFLQKDKLPSTPRQSPMSRQSTTSRPPPAVHAVTVHEEDIEDPVVNACHGPTADTPDPVVGDFEKLWGDRYI